MSDISAGTDSRYLLSTMFQSYPKDWDTFAEIVFLLDIMFYIIIWFMIFFLQRPHKATAEEMTKYHSDDYIKFLKTIRPENMSEYNKQMQRCEYKRR